LQNGFHDIHLYDATLLSELDWGSRKANFKNGISPTNVGEGLVMRPLNSGDYERGFLKLLEQLTNVGDVTKEMYSERFHSMMSCTGTYYITVVEDTSAGEIVGAASLIIEQKFIHSAASRGRIEDVVINSEYRGKQLGKLLVETMTLLGKYLGIYKISLECKDSNIGFYESFGYAKDIGNNYMQQRYKD